MKMSSLEREPHEASGGSLLVLEMTPSSSDHVMYSALPNI